MYKKTKGPKTTLKVNKSYLAETIVQKINRILNNKEPIKDGAPLIFIDRSEGVLPALDIRTDRFEVAIEAMDIAQKGNIARREARHKAKSIGEEAKENMQKEANSGQPGSTPTTESK